MRDQYFTGESATKSFGKSKSFRYGRLKIWRVKDNPPLLSQPGPYRAKMYTVQSEGIKPAFVQTKDVNGLRQDRLIDSWL